MSETRSIDPDSWRGALNIVISKPHSVDKRLAGQETLASAGIESSEDSELTCDKFLLNPNYLEKHFSSCENDEEVVRAFSFKLEMTEDENHKNDQKKIFIILQKLISRKDNFDHFYQIVAKFENIVQFIPLNTTDSRSYQIGLQQAANSAESQIWEHVVPVNDDFHVGVTLAPDSGRKQSDWVRERLVPRLINWAATRCHHNQSQVESVHLVGLESYCQEYARLKHKYAGDIIENWKESSDPEKFVHEDIGIAAYILLLWRLQRQSEFWEEDKKQTFVDLGCGNGLLVYILTLEGHSGVGYDIRRRNIWSWYPQTVNLEEKTIIPGLDVSFPGVDWILGNHSDELTPWIPVLASLSGPSTNFWILPCCPFNFTSKYQRKNALVSVWRDYLDWLLDLCCEIGFQVNEDRMKIPSTKRVCLVGYQTNTLEKEGLRNLINTDTFVPRAKVEKVRNCTKLEKTFSNSIVFKVVNWCLGQENYIEINNKRWNSGGCLPLSDIVEKLKAEHVDLSKLKQECGGLQTLFRNHHYIFVVEKGSVRIRVPGKDIKKSVKEPSKDRIKTKPCWHFVNHPDGCPLPDESCQWIH